MEEVWEESKKEMGVKKETGETGKGKQLTEGGQWEDGEKRRS